MLTRIYDLVLCDFGSIGTVSRNGRLHESQRYLHKKEVGYMSDIKLTAMSKQGG